jgi:hypothetical protein
MANISASELKRALSVGNRRDLELPVNANSPYLNPPTLVLLDTPNNIHANPGSMLTAFHIQPGNSTGQIRYSVDKGDVGNDADARVGFHFWWENSSSNSVLLTDVTSRLTINGVWEVSAACGRFRPYDNSLSLLSAADLGVLELWNNQRSTNGPPAGVASFDIIGGLCKTDPQGQHKKEWIINKSYDVKYDTLEVPPNGKVLFDVVLITATTIFGGPCVASVNTSIMCPFLQFEVREAIQKGPPLP